MNTAADKPRQQQLLHHSRRLTESGGNERDEQKEAFILDDVSSEAAQTLNKIS